MTPDRFAAFGSAPFSSRSSTHSRARVERGEDQRRVALRVAGIHVRAGLDQLADGLRVRVSDRRGQGGRHRRCPGAARRREPFEAKAGWSWERPANRRIAAPRSETRFPQRFRPAIKSLLLRLGDEPPGRGESSPRAASGDDCHLTLCAIPWDCIPFVASCREGRSRQGNDKARAARRIEGTCGRASSHASQRNRPGVTPTRRLK